MWMRRSIRVVEEHAGIVYEARAKSADEQNDATKCLFAQMLSLSDKGFERRPMQHRA